MSRTGTAALNPQHRDRRVSVVIFLNRQSPKPLPDTYGGGSLTFYGLLAGRNGRNAVFPWWLSRAF